MNYPRAKRSRRTRKAHNFFEIGDLIGSKISNRIGIVVDIIVNQHNKDDPFYKVWWFHIQAMEIGKYGSVFGVNKVSQQFSP